MSCSTDCSVRLFRLPFAPFEAAGDVADEASAVVEFQGKHAFRGIDHHWSQNRFATAGAQVRIPVRSLMRSQACPRNAPRDG